MSNIELLYGFPIKLRDGRTIYVRPIVPADKSALKEGLRRMSRESRYRRFLSTSDELTPAQLVYLTEIDYVNHMSWVAFDLDAPGDHGVGVARYIRLKSKPSVAEAAVAVVDSHQKMGLGSILLSLIGLSAIHNEIEFFRGYVYEGNAPVLKMLKDWGTKVERDLDQMLRADIRLPKNLTDYPDSPIGHVFRNITENLVDSIFPFHFTPESELNRALEQREIHEEQRLQRLEELRNTPIRPRQLNREQDPPGDH